MKITHGFIYVLGLAASLYVGTALAHSFNIIFIAPSSEITSQTLLDGFLLATREQDAHSFEESDGHLGGLDSYIFKVDSFFGSNQLEAVIRETVPLFAVGDIVTDAARELLKQYQVVEVDLAASNFWASTLASRDRLTLMNGDSFRVAFEQAYGYRANSDALRGYLAARVIARVVRNSSGHPRFSPGKLKLSVEQALQTAPW